MRDASGIGLEVLDHAVEAFAQRVGDAVCEPRQQGRYVRPFRQQNRTAVFDPQSSQFQRRERVVHVRRQVPPLAREHEQRSARLQDELDPLVERGTRGGLGTAVRRDPQGPQLLHERLSVPDLELRRRPHGTLLQKSDQVLGRGPVPPNSLQRGPAHVLVMLQPQFPQLRDAHVLV